METLSAQTGQPIMEYQEPTTAKIEFKLYRTPEGKPTCCQKYMDGDFCMFLSFGNYGKGDPKCTFLCEILEYDTGDVYTGFTIPDENCPLWNLKKEAF